MEDFPIQPIGELVFIIPESKPPGAKILLPDWSRCLRGDVIAIGPDCVEVKVGDKVSFTAATGAESVVKGVATRVMRESEIDAVIEND